MAVTRKYPSIRVLEPQTSLFMQPLADCRAPGPKIGAAFAEEENVVDVPTVTRHFQHPLDEMIEPVEVHVGREELTGIGTNRQTMAGRRPSVAEPGERTDLGPPIELGTDDEHLVDHLEEALVVDALGEETAEDLEVHAREIGLDVEMNGEAKSTLVLQ